MRHRISAPYEQMMRQESDPGKLQFCLTGRCSASIFSSTFEAH